MELKNTFKSLVPPDKIQEEVLYLRKTCHSNPVMSMIAEQCLRLSKESPNSADGAFFTRCDALRDFVWERLNTGHWKDVDPRWRELYAFAALAKIAGIVQVAAKAELDSDEPKELTKELIKLCDLGWMMGAPVMDGVCAKLADKLSELVEDQQDQVPPAKRSRKDHVTTYSIPIPKRPKNVTELRRLSEGEADLVTFVSDFKGPETPVVLEGLLADWPALDKWDFDYLKRACGFRLVPVELGRRYTDNSWTQTLMTVGEFVDNYVNTSESDAGPTGYLAQYQLLDQVPRLKEDLEIPEFCFTGEDEEGEVDANVWFGPAGTVSPLHTDPKHNILCQVVGTKFVRLYPKDQTPRLFPYEGGMLSNTSRVDLEDVDWKKYPEFEEAKGFECVLGPGDALYIPPKCWHFVKSLSPSMSVSFWFQ